MATGNRVVVDQEIFPTIQKHIRKTRAIDMEGSSIAAVADIEAVENSIIVKGVQDYADSNKDDRFRCYAIEASYAFLHQFLNQELTPKRNQIFVLPSSLPPHLS